MARVAIAEPVAETRELLGRLVRRIGHDVVALGADDVDELPSTAVALVQPFASRDLARAIDGALAAAA